MADHKVPIITGTSLTIGDLLRWDGSNWVNYPDSNYGGSQVGFGSWGTVDSDGQALAESHAYLAKADGFVSAYVILAGSSDEIRIYVDTDDDPPTGGKKVMEVGYGFSNEPVGFCIPIKKGEYFEIQSDSGTPTIHWMTAFESSAPPEDQD